MYIYLGKTTQASRATKMSPATVVGGGFDSTIDAGGRYGRGGNRRSGVGVGGKPFGGVSVMPSIGGVNMGVCFSRFPRDTSQDLS